MLEKMTQNIVIKIPCSNRKLRKERYNNRKLIKSIYKTNIKFLLEIYKNRPEASTTPGLCCCCCSKHNKIKKEQVIEEI